MLDNNISFISPVIMMNNNEKGTSYGISEKEKNGKK